MPITPEFLVSFVASKKRDFPFLGVVLTGSTARGYALETSDVDLMAFYDTASKMDSGSDFFVLDDGTHVTIEHHDLNRFIDDTLDHRYNLGSLRILNKAKDSLVLGPSSAELDGLIGLAKRARLDVSVLLWVLDRLVACWGDLMTFEPAHQRQEMIRWVELLGSVELLCRQQGPSYSKPKWLYRNLRDAGFTDACQLLAYLYQSNRQDSESKLRALERLQQNHPLESLPATNRGFFKLMSRECREMTEKFPEDTGPVFRFAAASYYWLLYQADPALRLRDGRGFDEAEFEIFFARQLPSGYEPAQAREQFAALVARIGRSAVQHAESQWRGSVMSRKFVPYFMVSYGVPDLLPLSHRPTDIFPTMHADESPEKWLRTLVAFLNQKLA